MNNINRKIKSSIIIKMVFSIFAIVFVVFFINKIKNSYTTMDSLHSVSVKETKDILDKNEVLKGAYEMIGDIDNANSEISPTNLNLAKVDGEVVDEWAGTQFAADSNGPVPITAEDDLDTSVEENHSIAFQIFKKLQNKYMVFSQKLYNLCDIQPLIFVNQYNLDKNSLLAKYNPEAGTHIKGHSNTYYISNFSNVNVKYYDSDGNEIEDDNNIKDIMSMASVYTYYHNPYDYKTFLNYCYDLFDKSYTYVASMSEVYYCSGCMHYDDLLSSKSNIEKEITYEKIEKSHFEQSVPAKDVPYKAGTLKKMKDDSYNVLDGSYDEYISDIYNGRDTSDNNYCPGHIDLNVSVYVKTLSSTNGLISIDENYGNDRYSINKFWNGWDVLMKNRARTLLSKDWEQEYGISLSYVEFVKPLTQEEINYYMNRLPNDLSDERKNVVDTALRSVGRIPYYYGGKTSRGGYTKNYFGSKVRSDYKGRCLKGLDCSGWVNWVYQTAFNRQIISSEGTIKLASVGRKITRKDLLPGDIIVRPGIDSHVMMFLEWAQDGKMKVIHENGSVNNVSIGTFDAYYPYYRRILDI